MSPDSTHVLLSTNNTITFSRSDVASGFPPIKLHQKVIFNIRFGKNGHRNAFAIRLKAGASINSKEVAHPQPGRYNGNNKQGEDPVLERGKIFLLESKFGLIATDGVADHLLFYQSDVNKDVRSPLAQNDLVQFVKKEDPKLGFVAENIRKMEVVSIEKEEMIRDEIFHKEEDRRTEVVGFSFICMCRLGYLILFYLR